jgi:hypothetical protein
MALVPADEKRRQLLQRELPVIQERIAQRLNEARLLPVFVHDYEVDPYWAQVEPWLRAAGYAAKRTTRTRYEQSNADWGTGQTLQIKEEGYEIDYATTQ